MTITTTYKTNASGRSQIVAKGAGRQRTVNYDQSASVDINHACAAAALVRALPDTEDCSLAVAVIASIDKGTATHDQNDSGTVHKFTVSV